MERNYINPRPSDLPRSFTKAGETVATEPNPPSKVGEHQVRMVRPWRVAGIPLPTIAEVKAIASRAVTWLKDYFRTESGKGALSSAAQKELTVDCLGAGQDPTKDSVDELGIPDTFYKDANRGFDIITNIKNKRWSFQTEILKHAGTSKDGVEVTKSQAIKKALLEFCDTYLGGKRELLPLIGKQFQQANFSRINLTLSPLMGKAKFETPQTDRPFVMITEPNVRFELLGLNINQESASLDFIVSMDPTITAIAHGAASMVEYEAEDKKSQIKLTFKANIKVNLNAAMEVLNDLIRDKENIKEEGRGGFKEGTFAGNVTGGDFEYKLVTKSA